MPGQQHESINRVLAAIALTLAEELGFEIKHLNQGQYVDALTSHAFPTISANQLNQ
jgi:hypothetical protein